MRRFRFGLILVTVLCMTLCGCNRKSKTGDILNLTEKVYIDCHYRQNHFQRVYTDSDKIDVILKYLHALSPNTQILYPPGQAAGDRCQITVYLWNGSSRCYDLQGKGYLCKNSGNWQAVDPDEANIIYHLVNHIESD